MSAKIVSVYNQKGGCGKTTTAINFAVYCSLHGLRVFIADLDPQESASAWAANAPRDEPFPAECESMSVLGDKFDSKIEKKIDSGMYDLIIIDCPPAVNDRLAQIALVISDVVVVPTIPSPIDSHATNAGFELINTVRRLKSKNNAKLDVLLLNSMIKKSNLARALISDSKNQANKKGFITLENGISHRTCYTEVVLYGKGISQYKTAPKEALIETEAVCEEILSYVFSDIIADNSKENLNA